MRADLSIREAVSDQDIVAVHHLLMSVEDEVALVPANPVRLLHSIARLIRDPGTPSCVLIAILDGIVVGSLAITEVTPDYSDHSILMDRWFQVAPDHRGGDVGPALLQEARTIADYAKKPLIIKVVNPSRRRGHAVRYAQMLNYNPAGTMLVFQPRA